MFFIAITFLKKFHVDFLVSNQKLDVQLNKNKNIQPIVKR